MSRQVAPRKPPINTQPLGFWQQVYWGLSTVLGAGIFVGIGIAAEVGGHRLVEALTLAAFVALASRWSAAQIAVISPSGLPLYPAWLQFVLDCTLFLARLTAVAIATFGLAGYLLKLFPADPIWLVPIALIALLMLAVATLREPLNPKLLGAAIVIAVVALLSLILASLFNPNPNFPTASTSSANFLQAAALMVVAYAGSKNPLPAPNRQLARQTLAANSFALLLIWLLYAGVATVSLASVGATGLGRSAEADGASLINVMQLALPNGVYLICLGAVTAMAAMIITLLPLLSKALLEFNQSATVTRHQSRSPLSLVVVLLIISGMLLVGEVRTIWSFSAFAFLTYTALTFWVAFRQTQSRLYPRWLDGIGLAVCLCLAFSLEWNVWLVSLSLIALGLIWRGMTHWSNEEE